jgi:hypothetical protein
VHATAVVSCPRAAPTMGVWRGGRATCGAVILPWCVLVRRQFTAPCGSACRLQLWLPLHAVNILITACGAVSHFLLLLLLLQVYFGSACVKPGSTIWQQTQELAQQVNGQGLLIPPVLASIAKRSLAPRLPSYHGLTCSMVKASDCCCTVLVRSHGF